MESLLLPRLEQYAYNNNVGNIDATVEYLRRSYREYQRKQLVPFRKAVARAVQVLRQRMREEEEEEGIAGEVDAETGSRRTPRGKDKLELKEEEHVRRRRGRAGDGSEVTAIESSSSEDDARKAGKSSKVPSSDSDSDSELDKQKPSINLLNSSIMATYNARPALLIDNSTPPIQLFEGKSAGFPGKPHSKVQQAVPMQDLKTGFASPEAVAAAARAASSRKPQKSKKLTSDSKIDFDAAQTTGRNQNEVPITNEEMANHERIRKREREKDTEMNGSIRKAHAGKKSKTTLLKKQDVAAVKNLSFSRKAGNVRFKDLGGLDETIEQIVQFMGPFLFPEAYNRLGMRPKNGLLLHGPPGCGKTTLAHAIATEADVPFLKISAPEIVSGMSGESEAKLRSLFSEAIRLAPSIIFIDEIDAITSRRESSHREMERRIVTQLMTCMDELNQDLRAEEEEDDEKNVPFVLVIGATNRPEALDSALRRPGRFDQEICLGIPDENARIQILKVLTRKLHVEGSFDLKKIAARTPGFGGADLAALTKEAGCIAIRRITGARKNGASEMISGNSDGNESEEEPWWRKAWTEDELQSLSITMQDFLNAIEKVQPSTKREGFSSIPSVTWEDVGSLESVREEFELHICRRVRHPKAYEEMGMNEVGFLMYGPPGCGKTLVAKAVANAAGANFIYVKGSELLNKYVGESERAVMQLFSRARTCTPCIIFFDEIDALAPLRGKDGNAATDRVVNQLLIEMDGIEGRKGLYLIGATNRADIVDRALLRPGRLGKLIYMALPDAKGRASILSTLVRRKPLAADVDVVAIAHSDTCNGFSGADLSHLVNEACSAAIRERMKEKNQKSDDDVDDDDDDCGGKLFLHAKHFEEALKNMSPSVSIKELAHYESLPRKLNQQCGNGDKKKYTFTSTAAASKA